MDEHRDIDVKAETLSPSSLKLYETQFFGFTPRNCMLRIYVAFESSLGNALLSGENMCVKEHSKGRSDEANELLRCQVRECRRELQRVLLDRFNKLYKRMEALLVLRCFTVPPNVLLPKDQVHREQLNDMQEVSRLESSLEDLQRAYEAEVCARQTLLAELEEQKEVQKQLDGIRTWVRELQEAWVKEGNGTFHESFGMVMESVKNLQEAVREICTKAP